MSLEEIKKTELWRRLERNRVFDSNFERMMTKISRYKTPPKYEIVGDRLVVTLLTEVCQYDPFKQCRKVRIYEFSIDDDNKLLLYKKKGTLSTKRGEEYDTSNSGAIELKYSCTLFDGDGIVLSYQEYTDDRDLEEHTLNEYKKDPVMFVNDAHDPHLIYFASEEQVDKIQTEGERIVCLRPGIIGSENNVYIKKYRNEGELEISHKIATSFYPNGAMKYLTHNVFISTLSSDGRVNYNPDYITVGDDKYAFATQDGKGDLHFICNGLVKDITSENYRKIARGKFLYEVAVNRDIISKESDRRDVVETLDILAKKIDEEKEKEKRI